MQDGSITAREAEKIMVPARYEYEYDDFLGDGPYEKGDIRAASNRPRLEIIDGN